MSFKQAALFASADVPSTQWVSAQQPADLFGQASLASQNIQESKGATVADVKLSRAQLHPRVATVRVQGLRPSLPPTAYSFKAVLAVLDLFSVFVAIRRRYGQLLSIILGFNSS